MWPFLRPFPFVPVPPASWLCGCVAVQHNHTVTKETCKEKPACAVLAAQRVLVLVANFELIDEPFVDRLQATPSCRPRETGAAIRADLLARCRPLADRAEVGLVGSDELGDLLARRVFPYWRRRPVVRLLDVVVTPAAAVRRGLTLLKDDVEDRRHHVSGTWASGSLGCVMVASAHASSVDIVAPRKR